MGRGIASDNGITNEETCTKNQGGSSKITLRPNSKPNLTYYTMPISNSSHININAEDKQVNKINRSDPSGNIRYL